MNECKFHDSHEHGLLKTEQQPIVLSCSQNYFAGQLPVLGETHALPKGSARNSC